MEVSKRLEYLNNGTMKGINISAIVESPSRGIGWVQKFKVSKLENAEEDICEIISMQNKECDYEDRIIFIRICS